MTRRGARAWLLAALAAAPGCSAPSERAPAQTARPAAGGPDSMQVLATRVRVAGAGRRPSRSRLCGRVLRTGGMADGRGQAAAGRHRPRRRRLAGRPAGAAEAPSEGAEPIDLLRHRYLSRQLEALRARVTMLQGTKLSFDEESKALYDAVAPRHDVQRVRGGPGPSSTRRCPVQARCSTAIRASATRYVIPAARLDATFKAAIDGCRQRTLAHVRLPPEERFTIEYVTDKSWSGYNWYQGGYRSVIQINTDLPIFVDRAIDLACHEGYPGHHVYNVLLEKALVRDRGWPEYQVYALFSPQSLIAEGTANYGIEVAFPPADRLAFEREVIFPAAGLDPGRGRALLRGHGPGGPAVVCRQRGGAALRRRRIRRHGGRRLAGDATACIRRPAPEQRVRFIDQYRSYVINYNLGKDMVARYVDGAAGERPVAPVGRVRRAAGLAPAAVVAHGDRRGPVALERCRALHRDCRTRRAGGPAARRAPGSGAGGRRAADRRRGGGRQSSRRVAAAGRLSAAARRERRSRARGRRARRGRGGRVSMDGAWATRCARWWLAAATPAAASRRPRSACRCRRA